jgi:hypothetical protein
MDEISADPQINRGGQPNSRESATSVSIRTQGASYRIEIKTLFAQLEIARQYRAMYGLERQFGNPMKWAKVMGPADVDYQFYHGELFVNDHEFDYTLNGYTGNRLIDFQQFIQGLQVMSATGLISEFDPKEIAKMYIERCNIRGSDRMLKKPELITEGFFRDPVDENKRMAYYGEDVGVLPGEQHGRHMPVHQRLLDTPGLPLDIRSRADAHQKQHIAMFVADRQAQMATQAQALAQNRMSQMAAQGAVPEPAAMPNEGYAVAATPGGLTMGGANNVRR